MKRSTIVEMDNNSLRLIAFLVHSYIEDNPHNKRALLVLDELIEQTDFVHRDNRKHKAFPAP